ncbi:SAF domain-containing protein [Agromyces ramosus]|uniref:SAF domain-containing protein n=1 Tax=Agromyces ramosus TaxID=33879 RepID=A0ABU0RBK1_9MICO|nr:SAF domain-containing protein [Agromyces ramosus]MDQ0895460.1 hypothetical protein [Agromyces ramosus]
MARRPARGDRGAMRLDPRLLIGMALIAGSTLGGWALVTGLDDATEVYVARETVTPGTTIEAGDLAIASVRLGASTAGYLQPGDLPARGLVVTRTVEGGELVPDSAVDEVDRTGLATIVVPSRGALPTGLGAGSRVDVWTARQVERGGFEPPAVLAADAEVAGIVASDGMVASESLSVELLVPREKVAALLQALAAGDAIDLVPSRADGN